MKKYKVLKKCKPFLVKGTVLEMTLKRKFTGEGINSLLNNKTIEEIEEIEEIQEPEFTQREMKDRCVNFLHNNSGHTLNSAIEIYDSWIKPPE